MAVVSHSETVTSGAAVRLNDNDGVCLLINTTQTILLGGPGAQTFPLTATDDSAYEFEVGVGEELWAIASSTTATVEVLEFGA